MRKTVIKKVKPVKPRNGGKFTESAFWSFIRSTLRQKSRWWIPISMAKKNARRPYKGSNNRQKFEYKCAKCGKWFPEKAISVDHIIPAGSLNCADDLPGFVERLFCEVEGLQVLCNDTCHNEKTKNEKINKL